LEEHLGDPQSQLDADYLTMCVTLAKAVQD